jgi:P-type conjugative transfer protein TrbG
MTVFRSLILVVTLLAVCAVAALADPARWIRAQYHALGEVDIPCAVGYLCEVVLEPGEVIRNSLLPSEHEWESSQAFDGANVLTPHLILSPHRSGLASNIILTTNRRVYRFSIHSVDDKRPTYILFDYSLERALAYRAVAARPSPVPTPFDAHVVCTAISFPTYHIAGPRPWRPSIACNDGSHTYVQLPSSSTVPTDLPVIFNHLDRDRKDQMVNWTYDAQNRVYRIDGVYDHLVLAIGRVRINVIRASHGK